MSCYFESESGTIWNPSNSTARIFIGYARVLEEIVQANSGLSDFVDDECFVDALQFERFCQQVGSLVCRGNNEIIASLVREFALTCAVLLKRLGLESKVVSPGAPTSVQWKEELAARERRMPT